MVTNSTYIKTTKPQKRAQKPGKPGQDKEKGKPWVRVNKRDAWQ